ncbi:MAG: hypothetical protein FWC39_10400 [Bacteroidetes bacterium]|nr:hypothetical protein [Bacteroidota bacterium]
MKKIIVLQIVFVLCFLHIAQAQNTDTTDVGVVINGVKWATRNVGEKGKFVENPEDYGNLYAWNDTKSACPSRWRLPTKQEYDNLYAPGSTWTTQNGTYGRIFGSDNNLIFLPAAGYYDHNPDKFHHKGARGYYWSSSAQGSNLAYYFHLSGANSVGTVAGFIQTRYSVRCVAE